jgi:hypothetical protein
MVTPKPITFTYSYADYKVLNRLMRRDSPWKRWRYFAVPFLAALLLAIVMMILSLIGGRSISNVLGYLVGRWEFWAFIAASSPVVWIIDQVELKLYYKRQRADGMVISVGFDAAKGITSESSSGLGVIPWSAVRKVVSDADAHVVLYENRAIGMCLPRRAFETQKDFDDIRSYISAQIAITPAA